MYLCSLIPHSASIVLTYTMKHKGPSHEPCGTAPFIVSLDDTSSPISIDLGGLDFGIGTISALFQHDGTDPSRIEDAAYWPGY